MVVVTVIAVISALALPSMVQAMRERRVQQAGITVMNIVQGARTRAMYRGRAQIVRVQPSGGALALDVWEGDSNSCRLSVWGGAGGMVAPNRVASLDLNDAAYTADNIRALISSPSGVSTLYICYTPLGHTFFSHTAPTGDWSDDPSARGGGTGGYVVQVYQVRSGSDHGVRRNILIPMGGLVRFRP